MKCARVENSEQLSRAFGIRMEVFVKEQGVPRDIELDEYDESPAACNHYLVETEEGEAIAAGRFKPFGPGEAKMQRIAVRRTYRGQGVGKFLLLAMEEEAKRAGYRVAVLDAQCDAEAFYAKQGYATESPEPFLDAGIPHVRMRKNL